MRELTLLATAVMFLTRLPTGTLASGDAQALSASSRYFPLVGLLIAGGVMLVYSLVAWFSPDSIAITLMLLAGVLLTGAFHEDGLADVADSAGAFGIDNKLSIMRDSRVGTYGSLALILLMLGKYSALSSLVQHHWATIFACLIAAHVLSRWSSVFLMATVPYARPEASNRVVADAVDYRLLWQASGVALAAMLPVAIMLSASVYILLPATALICVLAAGRFRRWFGGITGDCLGAVNQGVELLILIYLASVLAP